MMHYSDGYQALMPYLIIKHANRFFDFMEAVFGAKQKLLLLRPENNLIKHAELTIGESCIMYAEATKEWPIQTAGVFIYVPDAAACFQRAMEHDARVVMPLTNMDYGLSGGVQDSFGNTWWITTANR